MKNRFLPLIVSVFIAIVLVFAVDDFIHDVIIGPLMYALWFVTVFVTSLPQQVFWGVFILVAAIIAIKSMTRESATKQQALKATISQRGPVATWSSMLERAEKQDFSRWRLAQALRKLTYETLSPAEPLNHQQSEGRSENSKPPLPPEIEAYFTAPMPSSQRFSWLWPQRRADSRWSALNLDPKTVVEYLEKESDPLLGE